MERKIIVSEALTIILLLILFRIRKNIPHGQKMIMGQTTPWHRNILKNLPLIHVAN